MTRSRYAQGRDTEYLAQKDLEAMGYSTLRMASSKGAADVVAFNRNGTRFIQCKRYTTRPGSFTADLAKLGSLSLPPYASAELWMRMAGRVGWVERVLIQHTFPGKMDVSTLDDLGREIAFTKNINPDPATDVAAKLAAAAKAQRWNDKQKEARKTRTPTPSSTVSTSSSNSPKTATRHAHSTDSLPSEQDLATPASPAETPPVADNWQQYLHGHGDPVRGCTRCDQLAAAMAADEPEFC
jgi:hypothetical protein